MFVYKIILAGIVFLLAIYEAIKIGFREPSPTKAYATIRVKLSQNMLTHGPLAVNRSLEVLNTTVTHNVRVETTTNKQKFSSILPATNNTPSKGNVTSSEENNAIRSRVSKNSIGNVPETTETTYVQIRMKRTTKSQIKLTVLMKQKSLHNKVQQ